MIAIRYLGLDTEWQDEDSVKEIAVCIISRVIKLCRLKSCAKSNLIVAMKAEDCIEVAMCGYQL